MRIRLPRSYTWSHARVSHSPRPPKRQTQRCPGGAGGHTQSPPHTLRIPSAQPPHDLHCSVSLPCPLAPLLPSQAVIARVVAALAGWKPWLAVNLNEFDPCAPNPRLERSPAGRTRGSYRDLCSWLSIISMSGHVEHHRLIPCHLSTRGGERRQRGGQTRFE